MNVSHRLALRFAIPMIALAALVVAGEPVTAFDDAVLAEASGSSLAVASEDVALHEADSAEVSEQRSRTAMRLRWAVTLPHSSRPLSIRVLP